MIHHLVMSLLVRCCTLLSYNSFCASAWFNKGVGVAGRENASPPLQAANKGLTGCIELYLICLKQTNAILKI